MRSFAAIAPYLANPMVLIGFGLLLVFGVHRALIRSGILRPLSARSSSGIVRLILHYGFVLAILLILAGFGLAYWRADQRRALKPINRIDAEALLQRNRGNIERCVGGLDALYLDFVFSERPDSDLSVDVVLGKKQTEFQAHPLYLEAGIEESSRLPLDLFMPKETARRYRAGGLAFISGRMAAYPDVTIAASTGKLSALSPEANLCLIETLQPGLNSFAGVSPGPVLIHRYITDRGVLRSRMYSADIADFVIRSIRSRDFAAARKVVADALAVHYRFSERDVRAVIERAEQGANALRSGKITEEDYEDLCSALAEDIMTATQNVE